MPSLYERALDWAFPSRVERRLTAERHLAAVKRAIDEGKLPMPAVRKELGISGTANWWGSPQVEENPELQGEAGYGFPGSLEWGKWERMQRTDPAVATALELVTAPLRDAEVNVTPVSKELAPELWRVSTRIGEKTVTLAEAQAEFVKEQLLHRISWAEFMQQTVRGAIGNGFALHEPVLTNVRSANLIGPAGGSGFGLKKLAERLPSSVHPNGWLERNGELEGIRQHGQLPDGQWGEVVLPADAVLLNSWNRSGNNYLGFSQFRPVYYLVKARVEIVKTAAIAVIREGAGIPVAYADDPDSSLSKGQQKKLRKLLSNTVVHEHASLVMPPGWKAEWLFSPAANKGHVVDVYNAMGLVILQMVFGQQIVLGTQQSSSGSRAVGEVHDAQLHMFVKGVATSIEGVLNGVSERPYTGLAKKLIDPNYGPQDAYPRIGISLKQAKMDPGAKTTAITTGVKGGVITPTHDVEVTLREDLGLETISKEDWEARQEQKRAAAEAMAQQLKGESEGPEADEPDDEEPDEDDADEKPKPGAKKPPRKFEATPFTPWREMRATERFTEFQAIDSFLKRARDDFERGARPIVGEMLLKVLPEVRAAMGSLTDGKVDHSAIAALPLDSARLENFIGDFIARARAEGRRQLAGERKRGSRTRGQLTTEAVKLAAEEGDERDEAPIDDAAAERQDRNDELLAAKRKALVRKMTGRLRQQIEAEAIDVERTGGEPDDVVRDVLDAQLDTGAFRNDAGGVLMTAFNLGRDDFMAQYGDEVEGVELSALLDENTCDVCEEMDGEEFDFGSAGYEENTPPLRDCAGKNQCRCLYVVQWK